MDNQVKKVKESIENYADAATSGDLEGILSLYSEDAVFMPDGIKSLRKDQIGKSRSHQPARTAFKMKFIDVKIDLVDNFAFATAVARTSEKILESMPAVEKASRDFFVFRNENGHWKIIRYIFNSVKAPGSGDS